ncbi:MAG: AbrB/MazE/SpoVT family DNA-binding domain-containing protein [Verrucomicrobia bacterium]|nr:AbrB/MazE/SpoVT family DNA-binding domain-containing protein [Verrucomicrobiota bacterium]
MNYHFPMITTIDQAGRVVIPKMLRQKYHLLSRTEVEILPDGDGLRLRVPQQAGRFAEKEGVLVQCAETPSELDATAFINQLREMRAMETPAPPERR